MSEIQFAYPHVQLLIDGVWRPGARGADPARSSIPRPTKCSASSRARPARISTPRSPPPSEGFAVWRKTSAYNRAKLMRKAAEIFAPARRLRRLADHARTGQAARAGQEGGADGADMIDWFAEEARRTYGQVIPARSEDVLQMTVKLPVGPVAAFTPWNFPINQVVRKLSAALATGCSIIVKAPEETPASPAELMRAFVDAGVPAGVVNLVYGVPSEISEYLIPHPIIQKISFTGSTPVGKHLAALAGAHMKRATMELGGHAPVIVCADADIAERRQGDRRLEIPQRRAGLRLADALPGRTPAFAGFLERSPRRQGGQGRQRPGGRRRDGPARQRAPHPRAGIPDRRRGRARRRTEDRRPADRQHRQFLRADGARQCADPRAHHERGAVRSGRDRQSVRRRSTPRSRKPTACPTASPPMPSRARTPTRIGSASASRRAWFRSTISASRCRKSLSAA